MQMNEKIRALSVIPVEKIGEQEHKFVQSIARAAEGAIQAGSVTGFSQIHHAMIDSLVAKHL